MSKVNMSLDLETLGTTPRSVIFSIGCVAFDATGILSEYYSLISIRNSQSFRFRINPQTEAWWDDQPEEAKVELNRAWETPHTVYDVLDTFGEWVVETAGDRDNVVMWGNGADFDNVLLTAYYNVFGMDPPWKYTNNRCLRTLKNVFPGFEPPRVGTLHNALDDAKHQAAWITNILKMYQPKLLEVS
jgi:hypothetical protein